LLQTSHHTGQRVRFLRSFRLRKSKDMHVKNYITLAKGSARWHQYPIDLYFPNILNSSCTNNRVAQRKRRKTPYKYYVIILLLKRGIIITGYHPVRIKLSLQIFCLNHILLTALTAYSCTELVEKNVLSISLNILNMQAYWYLDHLSKHKHV